MRVEIAKAERTNVYKPIKFVNSHFKALDLLANGASKKDVAQDVEVSEVTLNKWMKNKEFSEKLDKLILTRHPHYLADLQRRIQERISSKEGEKDKRTYYDYLELNRKVLQAEKDVGENIPYKPLVIIKQVFGEKEEVKTVVITTKDCTDTDK